jgi:dTDP-4-amino-4,6-dideoxygalactose transaminase
MSYQRAKGHATSYDVVESGYNYRMDDLRAALGIAQLAKIMHDLELRAKVRAHYIERLSAIPALTVPFALHAGFVSNYIFPIVLNQGDAAQRDQMRVTLADAGIQTSVHYPPVHRFSTYQPSDCELPITDMVADRLITLPMYSALSLVDVDFIANSLANILS